MFAVLVTGAPGAGKSVTLEALADALAYAGVAHATIDADEVAWAYPYPDDDRRPDYVRALWEAHRRAGHDLVLVGEVVETDEMLRALLDAVGADDHLLVRLEAPASLLRERIVEREPPDWSGLDHLLGLAEQSAAFEGLPGTHVVLDTEELPLDAVVERIRAARPDLLGG